MDRHTDAQIAIPSVNALAGQRLQRPVWIVLQRGEIKLPAAVGRPERALVPSEVSLLLALARGAQVRDLEPPQAAADDSEFVVSLVEQGLVGDERSSQWMLQNNLPAQDPAIAGDDDESITIRGVAMALVSPVLLKLSSRGFDYLDHDGRVLISLDLRELQAATVFGKPAKLGVARKAQSQLLGDDALTDPQFDALVVRLRQSGLLRVVEAENRQVLFKSRTDRSIERGWRELRLRQECTDRALSEERRREAERVKAGASSRVPVIPVTPQSFPLLSLGTVLSSARAYKEGMLETHFQILPDWANRVLRTLTPEDPPGIYLYSDYIWTTRQNYDHSDQVKAISPHSLVIHGGPDVPKYAADVEAYFAANRSLDIAVIGEGEATIPELLEALVGRVGNGPPDLRHLKEVAGIAFRDGDRIVRTADRERIADVNSIPSPFLTGLFDSSGDGGISIGVIESNRGCPYGCTFCDWGSATASKIRKFDLERVFAELEWCAKNRVGLIYLADANFGIFPRDVEIAQKVVDLKERYGFPQLFETNYAKNSVKYLSEIVRILTSARVLTTGLLSLQSMDQNTLDTIRRSNIKLEQYDNLAREFRKKGLPLGVDIMMGLPGATRESFLEDLQQCVDRDVRARVFPTQLLVNSPMNDPVYREANEVVTSNPISASWGDGSSADKPALVVSTSTFSRADYEEMGRMRVLFILLENFGILRFTSRFVRHAIGLREIEFYVGLFDDSQRDSVRWPTIAFVLETMPEMLLPPGSWRLFIDELQRYLVEVLGIEDDSALATVMKVQHALLPARDRVFPQRLELQHDVTAWHQRRFAAKDDGHVVDWPAVVPPLREFGPGVFIVDDPQRVCEVGLGTSWSFDIDSDWELGSPIARPMSNRQEYI